MTVVFAVLAWLAIASTALAFGFRKTIVAAWREPVLRCPVLILESDDWGYGPVDQAPRLDEIAQLLALRCDATGRHPVMTIGIILAGPDSARMRGDGTGAYHRTTLADPCMGEVREAMLRGADHGVFALQLHGMEHYWPACLVRAAQANEAIARWLTEAGFPRTEDLPSPLQSRWIDAVSLPSRPLPEDDVVAAAAEEVRVFAAIFNRPPSVVVPPTFVWTQQVERAWCHAGIRVVVTPGRRYESRDAQGKVVATGRTYFNGELGKFGACHVVRDRYFEPALGHDHQRAIDDLGEKARLGQPALIEIHRMNFLGDDRIRRQAMKELSNLLEGACRTFPSVRFMSTAELATHYCEKTDLVDLRIRGRAHVALRRLACHSRLRKLVWLTGAIVPAGIVYLVTWTKAPA